MYLDTHAGVVTIMKKNACKPAYGCHLHLTGIIYLPSYIMSVAMTYNVVCGPLVFIPTIHEECYRDFTSGIGSNSSIGKYLGNVK